MKAPERRRSLPAPTSFAPMKASGGRAGKAAARGLIKAPERRRSRAAPTSFAPVKASGGGRKAAARG